MYMFTIYYFKTRYIIVLSTREDKIVFHTWCFVGIHSIMSMCFYLYKIIKQACTAMWFSIFQNEKYNFLHIFYPHTRNVFHFTKSSSTNNNSYTLILLFILFPCALYVQYTYIYHTQKHFLNPHVNCNTRGRKYFLFFFRIHGLTINLLIFMMFFFCTYVIRGSST